MCLYTCVPVAQGGQKRASESLELELQTVLSLHVGPVEEQMVLLTAEPSLCPLEYILYLKKAPLYCTESTAYCYHLLLSRTGDRLSNFLCLPMSTKAIS